MDWNKVKGTAQSLVDQASDAVSGAMDEFNAALPVLRALGFSVEGVQMKMGVLPEVSAKLIAAADKVDVKALDGMIASHEAQKMLVAVLKALQTAYNVRDQLGDLGLRGVEVDLTIGLPPKVSIGFLKSVGGTAVPPAVVTGAA